MMWLVTGLGLVLVIEGLVIAFLPDRLDDLVKLLARISRDQRRFIGLSAALVGLIVVYLSHP
jgi:uncharacterized protein YjeT (DUF2065 family)